MIVRFYRVLIVPELRDEFEEQFREIAEQFVASRAGLVSVTFGKPIESAPTEFAPNVYAMVSIWEDIDSVKQFAGERWNEPVIPEHMNKFTGACWLDQFETF